MSPSSKSVTSEQVSDSVSGVSVGSHSGLPGLVQLGEVAAGGGQLLRRAVLQHASLIDDQHPVGDSHSREPVGDDQCCPVPQQLLQALLHQLLERARALGTSRVRR